MSDDAAELYPASIPCADMGDPYDTDLHAGGCHGQL